MPCAVACIRWMAAPTFCRSSTVSLGEPSFCTSLFKRDTSFWSLKTLAISSLTSCASGPMRPGDLC